MCLLVDNDKTREFLEKTPYEFYVYKIVRKYGDRYFTPWQDAEIKLNEYFLASTEPKFRTKTKSSFYRNGVVLEGGAIHCCLSLQDVKQYIQFGLSGCHVLKCKVYKNDLVAIGYFDSIGNPLSVAFKSILPIEDLGIIENL